jgi:hypothetical protein
MRSQNAIKQFLTIYSDVKGKTIPSQAWRGPEGFRKLKVPDFQTIDI